MCGECYNERQGKSCLRVAVEWGAAGEPAHAGTVTCRSACGDCSWGCSQRRRGVPVKLLRPVTVSLLLSTLLLVPTARWAATEPLRKARTPVTQQEQINEITQREQLENLQRAQELNETQKQLGQLRDQAVSR